MPDSKLMRLMEENRQLRHQLRESENYRSRAWGKSLSLKFSNAKKAYDAMTLLSKLRSLLFPPDTKGMELNIVCGRREVLIRWVQSSGKRRK